MRFYRNMFPFKPFKSKRGLLQAIDELKAEIDKNTGHQIALLSEWKNDAQIEGLGLEIHKQGAPAVRWRLKKKGDSGRRYVVLFQNDTKTLTDLLTGEALEMICAFEHHRILVNAKSKSLHSMLASMEHALTELNRIPLGTLETQG